MRKSIYQIHEDVPADHYDIGFENNHFQKIWHSTRIREIKQMIPDNPAKLLDVGCHAGFLLSNIITTKQHNIYGIDISKNAIDYAKRRIKNGNFSVADIHLLPFKNSSFNTVFCFEVLEHIADPHLALKEIRRVLKKNGLVILLVPTDNILFKIIWKIWNVFYPVWKHTHVQSFKSDRLLTMLKDCNFKIDKVKRFNLNMLLLVRAEKT